MAAVIRMPPLSELPRGSRRELVELLFVYYRAAKRPNLRVLADWIKDNENLAGTASRETIRRMLNGTVVPTKWSNAEAVFLALCDLAGVDPYGPVDEGYDDVDTHLDRFQARWNDAIDNPPPPPDPWGSTIGAGSADEPPF